MALIVKFFLGSQTWAIYAKLIHEPTTNRKEKLDLREPEFRRPFCSKFSLLGSEKAAHTPPYPSNSKRSSEYTSSSWNSP